jgi:hypothetical protein
MVEIRSDMGIDLAKIWPFWPDPATHARRSPTTAIGVGGFR